MAKTEPKPRAFELVGVTGADAGVEFPLDKPPITVGGRFLVAPDQEFWVVRSLSGREVMVSGELVAEAILVPGDSIVIETGEYTFRPKRGRFFPRPRLSPAVILLLLGGLTVLAGLAVRPLLDELATLRQPPAAAEPVPDAPKITDRAERGRRIATSRVLFAVALNDTSDPRFAPERLAVAARVFGTIETLLAPLDPPPPELDLARKQLERTRQQLGAAKDVIRRNAVIALQADRITSYRECLLQLIAIANDPNDEDYRWAVNQLQGLP